MSKRMRHYAIFLACHILILSLIYLKHENILTNRFTLFFLPLVLLAAYLEEIPGALLTTVLAALSVVASYGLKFISQEAAIVDIVCLGSLFGLVAIYSQRKDAIQKQQSELLSKQTQDLQAINSKVNKIQEQLASLDKHLKALVKLFELAKNLSSTLDLPALLDEARAEVEKLLPQLFSLTGANLVRLAFYIPIEGSADFLRAKAGGHQISDEGFPDRLKKTELELWFGKEWNSILVSNLGEDDRFKLFTRNTPFHALMGFPLLMHESVIGLMVLASPEPAVFNVADFNGIEMLGKQVVFALRKALLYHQVQTLSVTDSQTGLYVHRYFQERLREEIHRAERYHQFLSIIMLDMDHFKKVNDQYGHQAGDAVLAETAVRIREMAGTTALVARYGGEEFAVMLPNTPKARALQVGKGINTFLKATPIEVDGRKITVTISGGISTYPEDALDKEKLISTADLALYEAKHNGRDLVLVHSESPMKAE